jgi:hypothetical protein
MILAMVVLMEKDGEYFKDLIERIQEHLFDRCPHSVLVKHFAINQHFPLF